MVESSWVGLSPQKRLSSIRATQRCAGCHEITTLVPCGVRLEETLGDILDEEIPEGHLRLCDPCKTKLGHAHELFKRLLLVKNKVSKDEKAVRFMNMNTLKPNWLCYVCNTTCTTIVGHRQSCIPGNRNPTQQAQGSGAQSSDSRTNATRNKLVLGKRSAKTDRNAKSVKFDLRRKNQIGEDPSQVNRDQSGVQHNMAGGSGLQHNNAGGSRLQHNNTSGSALRHDDSDGSDFESDSETRRRQLNMAVGSGLQHDRAGGSGLQHNRAGGSGLQHNRAGGSGLQHNRAGGSGLQHNMTGGSGLQHKNIGGSELQQDTDLNHEETEHDQSHEHQLQRSNGKINTQRNDDYEQHQNISDKIKVIAMKEGIRTQVEMVGTSVIVISDDEGDKPRNKADTPKKQTTLDQFQFRSRAGPSAVRSDHADGDITSTSKEEVMPARAKLQDRLVPRPFICDVCDSCFNSSKGLRNHKATIGAQCPVCKDGFCTQRQLAAHKRTMHPRFSRTSNDHNGPVECRCCRKVYRSRREYNMHYTRMGGRCHGAPQGLIDSQCACQDVPQPVRRRHSVHPSDYRVFSDASVHTYIPTPRRHSVGEPVHIKVEPDIDIHERETPLLHELAPEISWAAQEVTKHSEELPSLAGRYLVGVEVDGVRAGAGGGVPAAQGQVGAAKGDSLHVSEVRVRDVGEMRDTGFQHRTGSCDSSQPSNQETPRAMSIFERRRRESGDETTTPRLNSLAQAYRRLTTDRHTSDSVNTTTPDEVLAAVSLVKSMYSKMMNMCEQLEPIVRDVEAAERPEQ